MSLGMVAVDPMTIMKRDYDDICGASLEKDKTSETTKNGYLYPKHVKVIEDIAPMASKMVDDIVSACMTFCSLKGKTKNYNAHIQC